ncbi:MAG TPA: zinc-binding alcohol dehydrogenase family protein [Pedobacter sp.]|uniref:zinc-binding alcohol dehydrogenase family protein n=1 Tax=Pedobacter sp. TaxID=1411316 RepID=UPI002CF0F353|nr:zinc-binding alcohol dehydrogenase family protein [Pedobacter sp.]HMI03041.1 zinc-binding alcohol dehydrogenase family protein [Pedobacter sp.]
MKTLVCTQPGNLKYTDTGAPEAKKGYTILKIKAIGICGTDLHAFEGKQPFFSYPRILGHEFAAEILQTDAEGFKAGQRVSAIPYFNCGNCIACNNGKPNCCVSMQVAGVHADGCMREYFSVPSASLVDGEGLKLEELAMVEPLAIAAHAIRRADVKDGMYVLIIGAGPIGLGLMEFARVAGAKVIAADINSERLDFCSAQLGVKHVLNSKTEDIRERLMEITGGDMPQVVIDATGSLVAINQSFQYIAHGGTYVLVGLQKENISFSQPEFHKREATLMSSRNATREDFDYVIQCIKGKLIDPGAFITHRVKFEEVKDQIHNWLGGNNGVIKALVELD